MGLQDILSKIQIKAIHLNFCLVISNGRLSKGREETLVVHRNIKSMIRSRLHQLIGERLNMRTASFRITHFITAITNRPVGIAVGCI